MLRLLKPAGVPAVLAVHAANAAYLARPPRSAIPTSRRRRPGADGLGATGKPPPPTERAADLPTNERSGRLLRRLGFVVVGYARDFQLIEGRWQDQVLVGLTNPEWRLPG